MHTLRGTTDTFLPSRHMEEKGNHSYNNIIIFVSKACHLNIPGLSLHRSVNLPTSARRTLGLLATPNVTIDFNAPAMHDAASICSYQARDTNKVIHHHRHHQTKRAIRVHEPNGLSATVMKRTPT